ncbi:hypothetical protein SAMN06297280_1370 [Arsukibacterium tuosuense]|uniref:PilZ domain-containing protein n=1 Tax=Arsukibacterium tuosuense TaxID=1323745 RepID=A0A285IMX4_9GAMM|nr:hypothetical protein [Arsukibacterium tuosuense]SNY49350.1 hypothetical protein SAMN06297280_1370 [Arsukibacterium tuosuense]
MQRNVMLSEEERGYFAELFDEHIDIVPSAENDLRHTISVTAEVPPAISSLLGRAKMTLLAEIGNYKLWFPLEMTLDEAGQFNPVLGIPEVVEYVGKQRSWRSTELEELDVSSAAFSGKVKLLSLSSTGMSLQFNCANIAEKISHHSELTLSLPDGQLLHLDMQPVRQQDTVLAARITTTSSNREALRRFLFQRHRQRHPTLYQNLKN